MALAFCRAIIRMRAAMRWPAEGVAGTGPSSSRWQPRPFCRTHAPALEGRLTLSWGRCLNYSCATTHEGDRPACSDCCEHGSSLAE